MSAAIAGKALAAARLKTSLRLYSPACTVKCDGIPIFRSQTARDLACLLDLNPSVVRWICMPPPVEADGNLYVADFAVWDADGASWLFDAPDRDQGFNPAHLKEAAQKKGFLYRRVDCVEIYEGFRLRNAKDLLRYGTHKATLDDRIRVMAALEEHGSLTVLDCLSAIRETKPTAALASMILQGLLEVELDGELIGPGTMVRRIRL